MSFDFFKTAKTVKLYKNPDIAEDSNGELDHDDITRIVVEIPTNKMITNANQTRAIVCQGANYILIKPLENFDKFEHLKQGKISELSIDIVGVVGYEFDAIGEDAIWNEQFEIYGDKLDCHNCIGDFKDFMLTAFTPSN